MSLLRSLAVTIITLMAILIALLRSFTVITFIAILIAVLRSFVFLFDSFFYNTNSIYYNNVIPLGFIIRKLLFKVVSYFQFTLIKSDCFAFLDTV